MTQVKIDEVLCLMCNVAAKISAHDTVPGRVIFLVKFLKEEKKGEERRLGQLEMRNQNKSLIGLAVIPTPPPVYGFSSLNFRSSGSKVG